MFNQKMARKIQKIKEKEKREISSDFFSLLSFLKREKIGVVNTEKRSWWLILPENQTTYILSETQNKNQIVLEIGCKRQYFHFVSDAVKALMEELEKII